MPTCTTTSPWGVCERNVWYTGDNPDGFWLNRIWLGIPDTDFGQIDACGCDVGCHPALDTSMIRGVGANGIWAKIMRGKRWLRPKATEQDGSPAVHNRNSTGRVAPILSGGRINRITAPIETERASVFMNEGFECYDKTACDTWPPQCGVPNVPLEGQPLEDTTTCIATTGGNCIDAFDGSSIPPHGRLEGVHEDLFFHQSNQKLPRSIDALYCRRADDPGENSEGALQYESPIFTGPTGPLYKPKFAFSWNSDSNSPGGWISNALIPCIDEIHASDCDQSDAYSSSQGGKQYYYEGHGDFHEWRLETEHTTKPAFINGDQANAAMRNAIMDYSLNNPLHITTEDITSRWIRLNGVDLKSPPDLWSREFNAVIGSEIEPHNNVYDHTIEVPVPADGYVEVAFEDLPAVATGTGDSDDGLESGVVELSVRGVLGIGEGQLGSLYYHPNVSGSTDDETYQRRELLGLNSQCETFTGDFRAVTKINSSQHSNTYQGDSWEHNMRFESPDGQSDKSGLEAGHTATIRLTVDELSTHSTCDGNGVLKIRLRFHTPIVLPDPESLPEAPVNEHPIAATFEARVARTGQRLRVHARLNRAKLDMSLVLEMYDRSQQPGGSVSFGMIPHVRLEHFMRVKYTAEWIDDAGLLVLDVPTIENGLVRPKVTREVDGHQVEDRLIYSFGGVDMEQPPQTQFSWFGWEGASDIQSVATGETYPELLGGTMPPYGIYGRDVPDVSTGDSSSCDQRRLFLRGQKVRGWLSHFRYSGSPSLPSTAKRNAYSGHFTINYAN